MSYNFNATYEVRRGIRNDRCFLELCEYFGLSITELESSRRSTRKFYVSRDYDNEWTRDADVLTIMHVLKIACSCLCLKWSRL